MSDTNGKGAAARLREHVKTLETAVVDVTGPSGFVYKFRKPSKFAALFQLGRLPQSAASRAVEKWIEAGVIKEGEENATAIQNLNTVDLIFDRMLDLSVEPRIVAKDPQGDNEVTVDQIPEDDLEFLFKWISSGGEMSRLLDTFPGRSDGNALASHSRKKQRAAA